jgi:uncharacterized membrane protein
MITGIAWIGASFYFIFLENNLNRTKNLREELAGNLWAVHGGGFYYLEKYKHSPEVIPKDLHWFKWEAYFTGLSGFTLLCIVYYYNAGAYMVDPSIMALSSIQAIGIGIGSIIVSWIVYDLMCKSPLVKHQKLFALIGFVLLVIMTYGLTHLLSARAAYIHIGAIIGIIMVLNVFFVIIPGQKLMVASALKGEIADPSYGENALRRSIHNNYMTLPVLFIMISNHFPSTFGNQHAWLVLAGLMLVGVSVRHWFNLRGKKIKNYWLLPFAIALLIVLIVYTMPKTKSLAHMSMAESTSISITDHQGMALIEKHCLSCHSTTPSSKIFVTAPKGLILDNFTSIQANAEIIKAQAVNAKIMPLGNTTKMTDEERQQLGDWLVKKKQ